MISDIRQLVTQIFRNNNITIPGNRKDVFEKFLQDEQNQNTIHVIIQQQHELMAKWKLEDRVTTIVQQPVRILNATVGKPYEALLHFEKLGWKDITEFKFEGLREVGLRYDEKTGQITGIPTQSGEREIVFRFKLEGQPAEAPFQEKIFPLIINPDPKSLWKNVESNRDDPFWKEDNVILLSPLSDKHILVASKRGRSHANVGSFREDDFAFSGLENNWSIVVVADGAGSARESRKGSELACKAVVGYFTEKGAVENMAAFDFLLEQYKKDTGEDTQKKLNRSVYDNLGKAVFHVHKQLQTFAQEQGLTLKDLSTTLAFTLLKKYDVGYAFLSFGVGDCPMAILNKNLSEVTLLNWIDVGEFSGGTRFITMPEIFQNEKFATRFNFKLMDDFSYLVLMSDGIYDPKFSVEANLGNVKKWQAFFRDLGGENEDGVKVELSAKNKETEQQFSQWMDFWSPGNHDDRTLAIVF